MAHRGFRLGALLRVAGVLALCCGATSAWAQKGSWDVVRSTYSYQAIALANDNTVNPFKGYYRWRNQEVIPQSEPARDAYQRYQWRDLETAEGQYNFSALLNDLSRARNEGRKFAFRLRMMAGYDDDQVYLPAYLTNHPSCLAGCGFWADDDAADPGLTFVPDWNDPYLLARARALLQALAQALGSDADLVWIDVGLYGQYGEWALHTGLYAYAPPGISAVTLANKREFARMHFEAFPTAQHVMFIPYSNKDALTWGLLEQTITDKPVGLRVDCLSRDGFFTQWSNRPDEWAAFENQWRIAPFVGEFCSFESGDPLDNPATARAQAAAYHVSTIGNGNFATSLPDAQRWSSLTASEQNDLLMLGREIGYRYSVDSASVDLAKSGLLSLSLQLANLGNAPSYEPWTVCAELLNSSGQLAWSGVLPADLNELPGAGAIQAVQQSWTLPKSLKAGSYSLRLVARDPRAANNPAYARPLLKWATNQRSSDGALPIATLRKR